MTGGITGNNNVVLAGTSSQGIRFSTNAVNNTGTVTANGTGTGTVLVDILGSNVTGVAQAGASPFTISSAFALSSTNNTLVLTGSGLFTLSGVITGAQILTVNANSTGGITQPGGISNGQSVTLNANSTGGITIATVSLNNTGTVTNSACGLRRHDHQLGHRHERHGRGREQRELVPDLVRGEYLHGRIDDQAWGRERRDQ